MFKILFSEINYIKKAKNFDDNLFLIESRDGEINLGEKTSLNVSGADIKCLTIRAELKLARYEYNRSTLAWCVIKESKDGIHLEGVYDSVKDIPISYLAFFALNFQDYYFDKMGIVQDENTEKLSNDVTIMESFAKDIKEKISVFNLNDEEKDDIVRYILLKKNIGATRQKEVNIKIGKDESWDQFKAIRALNDHGTGSKLPGISKKAFAAIETAAGSIRGYGNPIISSERY